MLLFRNVFAFPNASNKGLLHKKTIRGSRAGRRYVRDSSTIPATNTGHQVRNVVNDKQRNQPAFLPTILYTNCRSLTQWKLDELSVHKPDMICLTETWLNKNTSMDIKFIIVIEKINRSGVGILTVQNLATSQLESNTTNTYSAEWILP